MVKISKSIVFFVVKLHWQLQGEDGLLKRCGRHRDGAAMKRGYLAAYAETDA